MDFLDTLDLDVKNKRSHRVRSWYLYEQFKSLERNQLEAVKKLKDRSYQEQILRQELSERKARRKIYDQFGLCHSESRIELSVKSEGAKTTPLSVSADDIFEKLCEFQGVRLTHPTNSSPEHCSIDGTLCEDDFRDVDQYNDSTCYAESINSVVNVKSDATVTENLENETDFKETTIVDQINMYFDDVKDNLECIEKLTEIDDNDKIDAEDSLFSIKEIDAPIAAMKDKTGGTCENNVYAMWSKLVSFAYQIVQLNHGNCYVDYGSQFLTAVLACDILRRGINRMCHILQPYVSPIRFASDASNSSTDSKKSNIRKKPRSYLSRHTERKTNFVKHKNTRKYRSENCWQHRSGCSTANLYEQKIRRASEPLRSTIFSLNPSVTSKPSKIIEWPDFSSDESVEQFLKKRCKFRSKVLNPMLKLSQYFDNVLKEIDDKMVA